MRADNGPFDAAGTLGQVIVVVATATEARLFPRTSALIAMLQSGMGPARAAAAAAAALKNGPRGLLSFGFAGGLSDDAAPGTILLPRRLRLADGACVSVSAGWHATVAALLDESCRPDTGDLVEAGTLIGSARGKRELGARTGATAVDMESATLAAVAQNARLPFLALRVVVDGPDDTVPAWSGLALTPAGDLAIMRLLAAMATHPADLPSLVTLGKRQHQAGRCLHHAARTALPALLQPVS